MKIGLDLSVLQTPHRMRGIGSVALNFINSMPAQVKAAHSFVFYLAKPAADEALELLDLGGIDYEIRYLQPAKQFNLKLPGKLRLLNSLANVLLKLYESRTGNPSFGDINDIDAFLQFDQMQPLPRGGHNVRKGIIAYDLIPYVLEAEYLWSYRTAREHGHSHKGSLRLALLRRRYLHQIKLAGRNADVLLAISEHTKNDFAKYAGIPKAKIEVTHLGINQSSPEHITDTPVFEKYVETSWGLFPKPADLTDKPFLLFVGGADPRRKLLDLFAAYHNLKAQGYDIRLVLAGDTMKGIPTLPTAELQKYAGQRSYKEDIYFLGFVTDEQREWLYDHALAMVYPSVYEGFGLPILEAMHYGTPVITYRNSSIVEIAGNAALYAEDSISIKQAAEKLLQDDKLREHYKLAGQKQAAKFAWSDAINAITDRLAAR